MSTHLPDGGSVLLDLEQEEYFGLNPVGTDLWRSLQAGATIDELVACVLAEYEAAEPQVRADVERIIEALLASGLVEAQVD